MERASEEEYTYRFVRVPVKGGMWSGKFSGEYQGTIEDFARQGWRFVQAFAPAIVGQGAAKYVDLIFERRVS